MRGGRRGSGRLGGRGGGLGGGDDDNGTQGGARRYDETCPIPIETESDHGKLRVEEQTNECVEMRQRTQSRMKRKHTSDDDDSGDNEEDDNRGERTKNKISRRELREDWLNSDSDSDSDIDELNSGFIQYSDEDFSQDSPNIQDEEEEEEDPGDEPIYHPGRIRLKNRLVNSLEESLNEDNYDR